MIRSIIGFGLVASLVAAASAASYADDTAVLERGKDVFRAQRCATCHAIAGAGNKSRPLDGVGSKLTPDVIRKWIVAPKEMDPKVRKKAYSLPPEELDALVAYLVSLKQP